MSNPTPNLSFLMRLYRGIWARRQLALRSVEQVSDGLGWIVRQVPLPQTVRTVSAELFYQSVEHLIVRAKGYQDWLQSGGGLSRLHGMLGHSAAAALPEEAVPPTSEEWRDLQAQEPPNRDAAEVAVLIPVYGGYDETLRCLYQVLSTTNEIPYQLCVINDASPDAALSDKLNALAGQGWFELITHRENQGFVRSVNEGMQRYAALDVVLLNADTEVYDGWLDRLMAALYAQERVASVTPLSNQAELCSYPTPFDANTQALKLSFAALDQLAARLDLKPVALPTAVGFCMAMRRAALDEVGQFDAECFGRGYGEENDWCLRASAKGWQHVCAPNLFVRHHGSVSFAGDKKPALKHALKQLNKRYPYYRALIRDVKRRDPLLTSRRALDEARLQHALKQQPAMLMISHTAGGGTERHIADMTQWLGEEAVQVLRLSPDDCKPQSVQLWHPEAQHTPNLSYNLVHEHEALVALLRRCGVFHLHLHHLAGFPASMPAFITRAARQLDCAYDVTIHDYYFACPSINLRVDDAQLCVGDNPTLEQSQRWAKTHPSAAGRMPVWQWREQHRQLLMQARRVFVPSEDTQRRMNGFFPQLEMTLRPHAETANTPRKKKADANATNAPLNVALIGRMVPHKGLDVVLRLAQDARARSLPMTYHIFGESDEAERLRQSGHVQLHGAYAENEIAQQLDEHACQISFFPSVWPETYNYTLSIALAAGLYPVCFDLGAPAERLKRIGWGEVLACELAEDASRLNDRLLSLKTSPPPDVLGMALKTERYASLLSDYYQLDHSSFLHR